MHLQIEITRFVRDYDIQNSKHRDFVFHILSLIGPTILVNFVKIFKIFLYELESISNKVGLMGTFWTN